MLTKLRARALELRTIAFHTSGLLSCPPDIVHFGRLTRLSLSHNQLSVLVSGFEALRTLQELRLDHNLFEEIPNSVLQLPNLVSLSLSHCQLRCLPSAAAPRTFRPKELVVDHNQIAELPTAFVASLRGLRVLDVRSNCISVVPASLYTLLPSILSLRVSGNPLSDAHSHDTDGGDTAASTVSSSLTGHSMTTGTMSAVLASQSQASVIAARDLEAFSIVALATEEAAVKAMLQKKIWRRSLVDLSW